MQISIIDILKLIPFPKSNIISAIGNNLAVKLEFKMGNFDLLKERIEGHLANIPKGSNADARSILADLLDYAEDLQGNASDGGDGWKSIAEDGFPDLEDNRKFVTYCEKTKKYGLRNPMQMMALVFGGEGTGIGVTHYKPIDLEYPN